MSGPTDREAAITQLRNELLQLAQEQFRSLIDAMYVGMSKEEAAVHEARRDRIRTLESTLRALIGAESP